MTAITFNTLSRGAPRLQAFVKLLSDIAAGVREGLEMERRYASLAQLSDAELGRRGLRREDILQAAVSGRLPR